MSLFKELRELEEKGIDLIEILGQDQHLRSPDDLREIIRSLDRVGESLPAELLFFLTHRRFKPAQAAAIWVAIIRHKRQMADRLGRTVSFRVAALDFLAGKNPQLRGVRLIPKEEFDGILSSLYLDELTAVHTRRYFNERLAAEVNRARRYGNALSLLLVDLDGFKRVNDELGHVCGDSLLRHIGRMLRENTRGSDVVCRYGGDEFAVLLPETSNSEAYTLAERIRKAAQTIPIDASSRASDGPGGAGNPALVVGVSIGGATFPADCDDGDELVSLADRLCLEAKRAGKNGVRMSGDRGAGLPPQGGGGPGR